MYIRHGGARLAIHAHRWIPSRAHAGDEGQSRSRLDRAGGMANALGIPELLNRGDQGVTHALSRRQVVRPLCVSVDNVVSDCKRAAGFLSGDFSLGLLPTRFDCSS